MKLKVGDYVKPKPNIYYDNWTVGIITRDFGHDSIKAELYGNNSYYYLVEIILPKFREGFGFFKNELRKINMTEKKLVALML